jgi:hypothetical protein
MDSLPFSRSDSIVVDLPSSASVAALHNKEMIIPYQEGNRVHGPGLSTNRRTYSEWAAFSLALMDISYLRTMPRVEMRPPITIRNTLNCALQSSTQVQISGPHRGG